jgi:type IV pilus assembly protein PilV
VAGFSLLEVLVTVLVLSIGLLGLAGLQASSLRNNHSAFLRSQAVLKAYEGLDRMRANRAAAVSGSYNGTYDSDYTVPGQTCDNICTSAQMAASDLREWVTALRRLPGGQGQIAVTNAGVATVQVSWDDDRNPDTGLQTFRLDTLL